MICINIYFIEIIFKTKYKLITEQINKSLSNNESTTA